MGFYDDRLLRESKILAQEYGGNWEDYYDELYEREMLDDENNCKTGFSLRFDEDYDR